MKSVKVPLKLKPTYTQDVTIVIGTFPNKAVSIVNNRAKKDTSRFQPIINHQMLPSPSTSSPSSSLQDVVSTNNIKDVNNSSQHSLESIPEEVSSPIYTHRMHSSSSTSDIVTPLPKLELDEQQSQPPNSRRRSYLPPYTSSSSSVTSSASSPITPPPYQNYYQAFDDYVPSLQQQQQRPTPYRVARSKSLLPPIDHILTPLPSMDETDGQSTYLSRRSTTSTKKDPAEHNIIFSSPHEIGPHDVLVSSERQTQEKTLALEVEDDVQRRRLSSPPGLLLRQDPLTLPDRFFSDLHRTRSSTTVPFSSSPAKLCF
ncbi:MAG: hypothetical protein EXX96DRAFT_343553 [Benjaminiella poitrasii]|nr:MAG: hypothetical protein EXX96DRAFT_343553 [Benjaminiella poitrasii]